jgi:phthiodiolone/phenolphthiodiolone dimycocerosates ketoreductase
MARHSIRLGLNFPAKPPMTNLKMLTRAARLIGIDTTMIWDHFQDFIPQAVWTEENTWLARDLSYPHEHYDYQVLLGHLASVAGNMRLGVGVTEPLRRHPVLIAQAIKTLSHMTKRAPILGIGAGERENTEPYGIPMESPVGKLEEALQIIRICYTSRGPFDFEGEHFQLKNAVMDLVPADGKTPPIWIAAHGPRMLRLTGQYGDGWYPAAPMSPEEYGDRLLTVKNHAREAGRDPNRITPSLSTPIILAPTDEDASEILHMRIARLLALAYPNEIFARHGLTHPLGEDFRGILDLIPEEIPEDELNDALDQISPDFLKATVIWGSPQSVGRRIQEYGKAGLEHIVVSPYSAMASPQMMRYLPVGLFKLRRMLQ